jgi:hypothetical protein
VSVCLSVCSEEVTTCSPVNCVKQLAKNFKHSRDTVLNICVAQFDSPIFEEEAEEYFVVSTPAIGPFSHARLLCLNITLTIFTQAIKKRLDKHKRITVELTQFLGRDHFEVVESLTDPNDGFTQVSV